MSILVNKDSRILVQGITGAEGNFHAQRCFEYGTNIVAGVTPGKAGKKAEGLPKVPIFNSVQDAYLATQPNVALIFVPVGSVATISPSAFRPPGLSQMLTSCA